MSQQVMVPCPRYGKCGSDQHKHDGIPLRKCRAIANREAREKGVKPNVTEEHIPRKRIFLPTGDSVNWEKAYGRMRLLAEDEERVMAIPNRGGQSILFTGRDSQGVLRREKQGPLLAHAREDATVTVDGVEIPWHFEVRDRQGKPVEVSEAELEQLSQAQDFSDRAQRQFGKIEERKAQEEANLQAHREREARTAAEPTEEPRRAFRAAEEPSARRRVPRPVKAVFKALGLWLRFMTRTGASQQQRAEYSQEDRRRDMRRDQRRRADEKRDRWEAAERRAAAAQSSGSRQR